MEMDNDGDDVGGEVSLGMENDMDITDTDIEGAVVVGASVFFAVSPFVGE